MGRNTAVVLLGLLSLIPLRAQMIPLDLTGVRPGPVTIEAAASAVTVHWQDEAQRNWTVVFSLDPKALLIASIGVNGASVIERARPFYQCTTGKRRGGWDAFFDLPLTHPDGARSFTAAFTPKSARATTIGNRLELAFDGYRMGIFEGTIRYVFFPGSRLIEQVAVMATQEPDTAYFYDAGLRMTAQKDLRPGGNMDSYVSYYDTHGELKTVASDGPERHPVAVRYRTIAARPGAGSIAVFPAPHQYFFPRDFTTNMSYAWHAAWKGGLWLGVRQLPDDATAFYPWSNAPPGTGQRMSLFLWLSPGEPAAALDEVRRFTHYDRYPAIDGYTTLASHWHFAYTVQALDKGPDWIPPFKPVLQDMGVNAAMIMDFHGDGNPRDTGEPRLEELAAYYQACRRQSGPDFLLIPAEEPNVHFGGHWAVSFPKPVYWHMSRGPSQAFRVQDPKYGTVYNVASAAELLDLVKSEDGFVYQTHPRTKGSTGFPDQIRDSAQFLDAHWFGAGWKALPSDLSTPRLGERAFRLLDDMSNWSLSKRLLGEVDVFQIDSTHELYAHMNVNYVKLSGVPAFRDYGKLLEAIARGDFFVTTGEVLLPEVRIDPGAGETIRVHARVQHTLPLEMAEIVWGDGSQTYRKIVPLTETGPFGDFSFSAEAEAKAWKWARFAVWDVAADGAFVNPVPRSRPPT
ncbi:MAG: hypothetical protein U0Q18_01825 [Bryobacteraceae bacterium]